MKRTSGRVGLILVLFSALMGACLTEKDGGDVAAMATLQAADDTSDAAASRNVVLAVRAQLERTLGKSSVFVSGSNAEGLGLDPVKTAPNPPQAIDAIASNDLIVAPKEAIADVELSVRADGAFHVRDARSGVAIEAVLVGAGSVAREKVGDFAVFRGGYEKGAHILQRQTEQGLEDYVYFPEKLPELSELRYELALNDKIAGLRLIARTIEMLDAEGTPRLRMNAPYAIDGNGRHLAVNVAIEGCAYDTSVAFPWGRPPTSPGASHCTVHLSWDKNAKAPLIVDPYWTQTDSMSEVRNNATSYAIGPNVDAKYRAIVVGGDPGPGMQASKTTEIFDEATRTWAMGPSLQVERTDHAMVNIGGALMVIGGRHISDQNTMVPINSAEKITFMPNMVPPIPSDWTTVPGQMATARSRPVAVVYSGGRVMVIGGLGTMNTALQTVEIFDPQGGGWQATGAQPLTTTVPRFGHTALLLPTAANTAEKIMIMGGKDDVGPTKSVELCVIPLNEPPFCTTDYADNVPLNMMPSPHANHVSVLDVSVAQSPRVFVFGGENSKNVDYYTIGTNAWASPNPLLVPRAFFTMTPFTWAGDHRYLIAGGENAGTRTKNVEIYDVSVKAITAGPPINTARARHTAVALADKRILIMGGADASDKTAELFQECVSNNDCPSTGYCGSNGMCQQLKPQGVPCNIETDCWNGTCEKNPCASTFCIDGVCCNNECTEQCAACNNKPPMGIPGTCSPVFGEPRGIRTDCYVGKDEADVECGGYCDGLDATKCVFPKSNRCDRSCDAETNTFTAFVCDGKGECGCPEGQKCEFMKSEPCGAYACDSTTKECATSCSPPKDGNEQVGCDSRIAICNIENQCIPSPTQCIDDNTMKLPNGLPQSCGNFQCVGTACLTVCNTAYDCLLDKTTKDPLFVCDESRQCVPFVPVTNDDSDVSCSTAPAQQSSRFGWLAAAALAGMIAARRNRARA